MKPIMDHDVRSTQPSPSIVAYSNRPPTSIQGGAVLVIANLGVKHWVGPGKVMPDAEWVKLIQDKLAESPVGIFEKPKTVEDCVELIRSHPSAFMLPLDMSPVQYNDDTISVYTFPVPRSLHNAHYRMTSNALIWPVMHSTDSTMLTNPKQALNKSHTPSYHYAHKDMQGISRDPEQDYNLYKALNDLGNGAIKQLRRRHVIRSSDPVWVHDYQCVNIKGDIYSHHIPFPPLGYLKQVTVGKDKTPLLKTDLFKSYIKEIASHRLITFQRPVDVKNFIETVAELEPATHRKLQEYLSKKIAIDESINVKLYGKDVRITNVPVGKRQDIDLQTAQESRLDNTNIPVEALDSVKLKYNESAIQTKDKSVAVIPVDTMNTHLGHLAKDALNHTQEERSKAAFDLKMLKQHTDLVISKDGVRYYPLEELKSLEIDYDKSDQAIAEATRNITIQQKTLPLLSLLGSKWNEEKQAYEGGMLDQSSEHRIIMAVHRADYTKSTIEKMIAAANYMAAHPEEIGKTHFLFFLEPTRSNVPGYNEYTKAVSDIARGLHTGWYGKLKWESSTLFSDGWKNSFTIVPYSINNKDALGLLRHPNVVGMLGIARKDGHDLTVREAANVRADLLTHENKSRTGLGIVTTSGIGASDTLGGTTENPGAFVIPLDDKDPSAHAKGGLTPFWTFIERLQQTFTDIITLSKNNPDVLQDRYRVASEASKKHDIGHYRKVILDALSSGQERTL